MRTTFINLWCAVLLKYLVDQVCVNTVEMLGVPDPHPRAVQGLVVAGVVLHPGDTPPAGHQVHPEHVPLHLDKAVHVCDYLVRSYPGVHRGRHVGIVLRIQEPSTVSVI